MSFFLISVDDSKNNYTEFFISIDFKNQQTHKEELKMKNKETLDDKMVKAKRRSSCIDLLVQLKKKFPIPELKKIDGLFMDQFLRTQATMIRTGIFVSIDFEKKVYFAVDLQLGEVIEQ